MAPARTPRSPDLTTLRPVSRDALGPRDGAALREGPGPVPAGIDLPASVVGTPATAASASLPAAPQILVAVGKVLVRHGLVRLLEDAGLGGRITAPAGTEPARRWLRCHRFDLVLVDPAQAAALGDSLRGAHRILVVTAREHAGEQPLAGRAWACGMLSEACDEAATGALLGEVAHCRQPGFDPARCAGCSALHTWRPAPLPLSPREREIFRRIGAGAGPQQIAGELGLSVKTVESYREKVKYKLGLADGDALLRAALRWHQGYAV